MTKFVIVGCGAAKRDGSRGQSYPAKELYTSTYFQNKREYAETLGDQWMILSAEHGLVPPTAELRPYETSIDDLADGEVDQLAHEVGMTLLEWVAWEQGNGNDVDEIVVLAGKRYLEPLRERETFHSGIEPPVVFPFQQNDLGGIGEQMAWLSARCDGHEQTTLVSDGGRANGTIRSDVVEAEYQGEEITIWNHLTVTQRHYVTAGQIESRQEISVGDAPGHEAPEYITPALDDQLRRLDVYPDAEVVDPMAEEVMLL